MNQMPKTTSESIQAQLGFLHYLQGCQQITEPANADLPSVCEKSSLLDALVKACVSEPDGVLAAAMRLPSAGRPAEVVVASDGNVSQETITQIKSMWRMLQRLSVKKRMLDVSGAQDILYVEGIIKEIETSIIRFTFRNIRERVLSAAERFEMVFNEYSIHTMAMGKVWMYLSKLKSVLVDDNGVNHRPPKLVAGTSLLARLLRRLSSYIDESLSQRQFSPDLPKDIKRYLVDVRDIMVNIDRLISCVQTHIMRRLLDHDLVVTALPAQHGSFNDFSTPINGWIPTLKKHIDFPSRIHKLYKHYRKKYPRHQTKYMLQTEIYRQVEDIDRPVAPTTTPSPLGSLDKIAVHCEAKLLAYLSNCNGPGGIIALLGVSREPCLGCIQFLRAYNKVRGTGFYMTSSWARPTPWCSPDYFVGYEKVLEGLNDRLAASWMPDCSGYTEEPTLPKAPPPSPGPLPSVPSSSTPRIRLTRFGAYIYCPRSQTVGRGTRLSTQEGNSGANIRSPRGWRRRMRLSKRE